MMAHNLQTGRSNKVVIALVQSIEDKIRARIELDQLMIRLVLDQRKKGNTMEQNQAANDYIKFMSWRSLIGTHIKYMKKS